jgi:hypothetical protein
LDVIIESCSTKIFLANPDMDRDLYRRQFHLNESEVELIASLIPKQQFLIKTPELAKVANLTVDAKSYWLYTNDPYDNKKRREAFETYGFEKGLEVLAGQRPCPAVHISAARDGGFCHGRTYFRAVARAVVRRRGPRFQVTQIVLNKEHVNETKDR